METTCKLQKLKIVLLQSWMMFSSILLWKEHTRLQILKKHSFAKTVFMKKQLEMAGSTEFL